MDHPRVLVVTSNSFNLVTGGGITLTNLFKGWPADRIANLHEDPQPEDHSVCSSFYRLSGKEIQPTWPFSIFMGSSDGAGALAPSATSTANPLASISKFVFGDGVPRRAVLSVPLREWLDEFQPEIIYSFLGSMAQIRLTAALTKQYGIPLVVHIMDDWPSVIYRHGLIGPVLRLGVLSEFKALLDSAAVRLAISDDMSQEYSLRFGVPFRAFHNAVDTEEWKRTGRKDWNSGRPFIVRYAGSIIQEAQRDALRDICAAVSAMRQRGHDVEMWVHAPANQGSFLEAYKFEGLHITGSPDPNAIVSLLAGADLLVLPFNFDRASADYMRLSMSTKVPAYMASGTPILVYGPESIAPVRYALRDGWACVLFQQGVDGLGAAIAKLMESPALRESYARRAQEIASQHHDSARVRYEFQRALASAQRK